MKSSSSSSKPSFLSSSEFFILSEFNRLFCYTTVLFLIKTFPSSSNSHNQKVQMHMLDLMSSIIMEGDGVTQELLDTILINLIPAHKVGKRLITSQSYFPVQSRCLTSVWLYLFLCFRT